MTFLQPLILVGLPLCLIPVLIHLMNRIRYRTVNWAAIMFLVKASHNSTSMARIRQFLILLLRILSLLVLLLALARPLAGGWVGLTFSGPPETVIIVLDRSASMGTEYSTRISRLRQAKSILASAGKSFSGSRFLLIENVNRKPVEIASPEILSDLSEAVQTQTASDIPSMIDEAVNYVIANKTGNTEIWVASDMQLNDWQPDNSKWNEVEAKIKSVPQPLRLRLLAMDSKSDENLSIRILKVNPLRQNDSQEAEIVFEISRNSSGESLVPITVCQGGNKRQINFKLGGALNKFRYKISKGANINDSCGYLELPSDCNLNDNRAYFSFPEPGQRKTVIVSDGKTFSNESLSIASYPENEVNHKTDKFFDSAKADLINFRETSLVIWLAPFPDEKIQKMLRQYLSEGGTIIFFPPEKDDTGKIFDSITWENCEVRKENEPVNVKEWDRRAGPLEDTASGESLALGDIRILKTRSLIGYGLNPLATCSNGKVFLARLKSLGGSAYFCTTLPETEWSSLGEGQILVPMIQRLVYEGGARLSKTVLADCGQLNSSETAASDLKDIDLNENKNPRFNSGVYKHGDRIIVMNRPASEDIQESIGVDEFGPALKKIPFTTLHEKSGKETNLNTEIWRSFFILMLLFLISEAFLCLPFPLNPIGITTKAQRHKGTEDGSAGVRKYKGS